MPLPRQCPAAPAGHPPGTVAPSARAPTPAAACQAPARPAVRAQQGRRRGKLAFPQLRALAGCAGRTGKKPRKQTGRERPWVMGLLGRTARRGRGAPVRSQVRGMRRAVFWPSPCWLGIPKFPKPTRADGDARRVPAPRVPGPRKSPVRARGPAPRPARVSTIVQVHGGRSTDAVRATRRGAGPRRRRGEPALLAAPSYLCDRHSIDRTTQVTDFSPRMPRVTHARVIGCTRAPMPRRISHRGHVEHRHDIRPTIGRTQKWP